MIGFNLGLNLWFFGIVVLFFLLFCGVYYNHATNKSSTKTNINIVYFSTFDGVDLDGKRAKIQHLKIGELYGFKVGSSYFLTDRNTFYKTITTHKKNFKWWLFQYKNNELLRVKDKVYIVTVNVDRCAIDFVINADFNDNCINSLNFTIYLQEFGNYGD